MTVRLFNKARYSMLCARKQMRISLALWLRRNQDKTCRTRTVIPGSEVPYDCACLRSCLRPNNARHLVLSAHSLNARPVFTNSFLHYCFLRLLFFFNFVPTIGHTERNWRAFCHIFSSLATSTWFTEASSIDLQELARPQDVIKPASQIEATNRNMT